LGSHNQQILRSEEQLICEACNASYSEKYGTHFRSLLAPKERPFVRHKQEVGGANPFSSASGSASTVSLPPRTNSEASHGSDDVKVPMTPARIAQLKQRIQQLEQELGLDPAVTSLTEPVTECASSSVHIILGQPHAAAMPEVK
jgi:hypothetical protein